MRSKLNAQSEFDFRPSNLKLTNEYYAKYQVISKVLDENPEIVDLVHRELKIPSKYARTKGGRGADHAYASDTVLRVLICQVIEGVSLREIVIRIDDSHFLRRFVRLYHGVMIDFTTVDKLRNSIRAQTWTKVNSLLAHFAVREKRVGADSIRLDTTAVETHVHWPTDSGLIWDVYRVLDRLIRDVRDLRPDVVGDRRLHPRRIKRLHVNISRLAGHRGQKRPSLKPLYKDLIERVEALLSWADDVVCALGNGRKRRQDASIDARVKALRDQIVHFTRLGRRVAGQARMRVLEERSVPNSQKIFSIFEPHTELLVRGKAGRDIEFGHMIQIQQVREKFITHYDVFDTKPIEHDLVETALLRHRELFHRYPTCVAADQAYSGDDKAARRLAAKVPLVAIRKRGKPSALEAQRQEDPAFRHAQRFRAGIEGTISFLKRVLGLDRCLNRGWPRYVATIGVTIFAHNLLVLARC